MRKSLLAVAAALVLGAVVAPASAPVAVAAPVTCTGNVKIFDGRADGTVWYYEHRAPATGGVSWLGGRMIGSGFQGPTVASIEGVLFYVSPAGQLRRYQYDGTRWVDGGGTVVGSGWQLWNTDRRNRLVADTRGRLYTVDETGTLVMFDATVPVWDADKGIPLATGWAGSRVIAAGDGALYRLDDATGALSRYRYDADAQRFTAQATNPVGAGWGIFDKVFSPGGDVLYAVVNGYLNWYRFDAETGAWADGGIGKLIGSEWQGRNSITANQGTCSTPNPPEVGAVTPVAARADHPLELAGVGTGFSYAYRDGQGRAVAARDAGDALTRTVLGDKRFTGDLSAATSRDPYGTRALLGVDAAGTVWLADGATTYSEWRQFGKGMRAAVLTEAFKPGDPLQALAVDGAGDLWWRMRGAPTHRWTPWQRVGKLGELTAAASGMGGAYGVAGRDWFTLERTGTDVTLQRGELPADYTSVSPAEVTGLPATFFARQDGTGAPVAWGPLPALPTAVSTAPMSATELGNGQLGVAVVGTDGVVWATTGSTETGEYLPWQRVGTQQAAGAAQLVAPTATSAELAYVGRDGRLYHFTAAVAAGSTTPLVFSGKGRL